MRIAVAGFQHESHSFAQYPADIPAFEKPGGFPPLSRGAAVIGAIAGTRVPAAGAVEAAQAEGHEVIPLAWGMAMPSAPVTEHAFETIAGWIVEGAAAAMPLDGLYLDLHGAMMAANAPDGEGELLRRLRERLGPDLPIAVSLDLHANVTRAMVDHADVLTAYRTYPHVDMKETGARAMQLLLARIAHGRPWARVFAPLDFLIPVNAQCTLMPPMQQIYGVLPDLMAACGAADLSFSMGFPYCDFEGCGPVITAYAVEQAAAADAAERLKRMVLDQRGALAGKLWPAEEAVAYARGHARLGGPPIVLADTQDNPGGGGHGDTMGLLAALVAGGAHGAVVGVINDPASAAAALAAGEGATIDLALGGVSDGAPYRGRFTVLRLGDGRFTCTGPMTRGNAADLGPTALLETEGVLVVVASRKMQAYDQAMFRHVGIDPSAVPIIALKSSVHFRADFQPIAKEILVVLAPGPVVADLSALPFTKLRPGLALRP